MEREAFDVFLEGISDCFIRRDLAAFRSLQMLPCTVSTVYSTTVMKTEEDVAECFGHYLKACDAMALDMVHRRPISLEPNEDGTWTGTYETRLLSRGSLVVPPYTSTCLLHLEDGKFRAASIMNARDQLAWVKEKTELAM